uniref:Hypotheticial protein n=1 Tax=Schistosoma japonicum TaxID=6182 RepID=C7TYL2_SCHJA|nr:hypotheticial protein [Schistosoma japonicum]
MSSDLHKFFLLIVVVSAVFCLIKYTLANNECQQSCWRMNLVCQRKCASNNSFTKCKEGCDKECIPKDDKTQCYNSCWGTNIECLRKCASDNSFTKCCDKVNEKCENTCRDGFQQCVFDSENCLSSRSQ